MNTQSTTTPTTTATVTYRWVGYTLELKAGEERFRLSEVAGEHGHKALCTRFVDHNGRLVGATVKHWPRRSEEARKRQAPSVKEPFAALAKAAYTGLCESGRVPFIELIAMCSETLQKPVQK